MSVKQIELYGLQLGRKLMLAKRPKQHGLCLGVRVMPVEGLNEDGLDLDETLLSVHCPS